MIIRIGTPFRLENSDHLARFAEHVPLPRTETNRFALLTPSFRRPAKSAGPLNVHRTNGDFQQSCFFVEREPAGFLKFISEPGKHPADTANLHQSKFKTNRKNIRSPVTFRTIKVPVVNVVLNCDWLREKESNLHLRSSKSDVLPVALSRNQSSPESQVQCPKSAWLKVTLDF